jgi:tRNA A37 threonylcarbamoyladenosine biosynthesis protein TsaE
LGLDEIINDASFPDSHSDGAVIVIEWAERVASLLPPDTLYITLTPVAADPNARTAILTAAGENSAALLRALSPTA